MRSGPSTRSSSPRPDPFRPRQRRGAPPAGRSGGARLAHAGAGSGRDGGPRAAETDEQDRDEHSPGANLDARGGPCRGRCGSIADTDRGWQVRLGIVKPAHGVWLGRGRWTSLVPASRRRSAWLSVRRPRTLENVVRGRELVDPSVRCAYLLAPVTVRQPDRGHGKTTGPGLVSRQRRRPRPGLEASPVGALSRCLRPAAFGGRGKIRLPAESLS